MTELLVEKLEHAEQQAIARIFDRTVEDLKQITGRPLVQKLSMGRRELSRDLTKINTQMILKIKEKSGSFFKPNRTVCIVAVSADNGLYEKVKEGQWSAKAQIDIKDESLRPMITTYVRKNQRIWTRYMQTLSANTQFSLEFKEFVLVIS